MLLVVVLVFVFLSLSASASDTFDFNSPFSNEFNHEVDDSAQTDQVLAMLKMTQTTLPDGEQFLANVLTKAADEIVALQNQLANCRRVTNCPGKPETTTPKPPTSTTTHRPVSKVNYTVTFCDFEDSTNCGYNQTKVNDTIRMWDKGQGVYSGGPIADHTFGIPQGHYMFINTHDAAIWFKRESFFYIESPLMSPAAHYCIKFWYSMRGAATQNLRVYAKIANGRGLGYPVWTRSGQQGGDWILGEVDLNSEYTSRPFRLVFEATSQSYYEHVFASHPRYHDTTGNTAIDDIYTFTARCKELPECPVGSHYSHGLNQTSCYTVHTQAKTWTQAALTCKQEHPSSHLVAVNTGEEQQYLVNLIKTNTDYKMAAESGLWTSGNDEDKKVFHWTGQGNPYGLVYANWFPGQPNDVGGHQDCLLLQYPDVDYQWGDVECLESHSFICEVDLEPSV